MRRMLLPLLLCSLLAVPLLPAAAEDEPPAPLTGEALRTQVKQWLAELRSDQFEVRETARAGLKLHGLRARDLLEAAKASEDPEVRRTVRGLLNDVSRPTVRTPAPGAAGKLDEMGLVSLELADVRVEDALKTLGAQMGAHFDVPEDAKARTVSLALKDEPCFGALRKLLDAAGLRMQKTFDASGAVTLGLADEDPMPPWAAAGPVLVEIVEVTATRTLGAVKPPRYALKLRVQWAPSVHVAQYEVPRVEVARDAKGGALKSAPSSSRSVRYGVGQYTRSATVQVHLEPIAGKAAELLSVLEIVLPVAGLQHDVAKVELRDVTRIPVCLGPDGEEAEPGTDEAVRFHALDKSDDGRSQWVADISATLLEQVPQRTVQVFTANADGRLARLQIYGGRSRAADGTVRLTARDWRSGADKPGSLVVTWFRREDAGSLRFRLTDIPLR